MADTPALKTTFALIVVNYGSSHLLERNLATIDVEHTGGVIVVVDNFTNREELARVDNLASKNRWELLALDTNEGFGRGVNVGAARAFELGAQSLITLNPDATISSTDLEKLAKLVLYDRKKMVAPIIRTSRGDIWFDGMWLFQKSGRVSSSRRPVQPRGPRVPWISGACFALSREMWEKVGGFDDEYFLYWEDVDLSRRVVANGGHLSVNTELSAIHDEGGTQGRTVDSRAKSEIYYYYNIRNRLIFAAKHLNRRELMTWIIQTPLVSYEILLGGGRRQFVESFAPWRAYFRGLFSGLARASWIRFQ